MIQICFDCRKILLLISYITQLRLQLSSHPYDDKKEKFFGGESFHGTSHNWQSKPGGTGFNGRSKVEKVVGFSILFCRPVKPSLNLLDATLNLQFVERFISKFR